MVYLLKVENKAVIKVKFIIMRTGWLLHCNGFVWTVLHKDITRREGAESSLVNPAAQAQKKNALMKSNNACKKKKKGEILFNNTYNLGHV